MPDWSVPSDAIEFEISSEDLSIGRSAVPGGSKAKSVYNRLELGRKAVSRAWGKNRGERPKLRGRLERRNGDRASRRAWARNGKDLECLYLPNGKHCI